MRKKVILIINLLLLVMITLIHMSTLKETLGSQSESNTSLALINGSDIKYALASVQNDTIPKYVELSATQIKEALTELPGWTIFNGKLHKTYTFKNFSTLFEFMYKIADSSQKLNHHPNMTSTWNTITIDYDTWSLGHVISNLDVKAAGNVERFYREHNYNEFSK
ncbi:MAG: 4a-hydroxytetrahydrobiopterin dehydratase [Nitrososphaeraceae archaeon]|nr:4a-hydroxytetrahydrobiopterin dehydratase [Nitrososphaeraceae archaeon]MDW0211205.1 4a-hydroxytetrahydrobiopterin dehydratase [Nitrososphaeraceae archaeon]MDW0217877.1 4a-hydroxytetrahydrobiopterin dehydratase [Nitrososphaeraceae archaeon]MDW0224047.1 4a-hydroxytetrahydrobiopterin dehydratase [Nitrososphaeraceae archaeon]MDW0234971.1 4a-hydroxytetrahydrobiopterin dehydratase [Nitrososphaeraceae archaeon]